MECAVQWERIIFIKMLKFGVKEIQSISFNGIESTLYIYIYFWLWKLFWNVKVFGSVEWVDERGKKGWRKGKKGW